MTKYRIIQHQERYYVQKRLLFGIWTWASLYGDVLSHETLEQAKEELASIKENDRLNRLDDKVVEEYDE